MRLPSRLPTRRALQRIPLAAEYGGLAAVVCGVWQLNHPAAWIAAGILLVVEAATSTVK